MALERLLAADVVSLSDGNGARGVARVPVVGRTKVSRFVAAFRPRFWPGTQNAWVEANGHSALLIKVDGAPLALLNVTASQGVITQLQWQLSATKIDGFLRSAVRFG